MIVLVRARDARRPEFGTLILAFVSGAGAPGGLMLEGWTAIDAQNKRTTVRLSNQRYNVAVPDSAFTYRRAEEAQEKRSNRKRFMRGDSLRAYIIGVRSLHCRGFPLLPGSAAITLRDERLVGPRSMPPERGPFRVCPGDRHQKALLHTAGRALQRLP